jgi:hypothetical protein
VFIHTFLSGGCSGKCDREISRFLWVPDLGNFTAGFIAAALLSGGHGDNMDTSDKDTLQKLLQYYVGGFDLEKFKTMQVAPWSKLALALIFVEHAKFAKIEDGSSHSRLFLASNLLKEHVMLHGPEDTNFLTKQLKDTFKDTFSGLLLRNENPEEGRRIFRGIFDNIQEIECFEGVMLPSQQRSEEEKSKESSKEQTDGDDTPKTTIQPTKTTKPTQDKQLTQSCALS